jgi:nicotinamide-nucleotide amidase
MINISEKLKDIMIIARKKNLVLSTAESCTGGLIAKYLTDLPGSSRIYDSSFITYSNESKMLLLGVKNDLINKHGAVSERVVIEMCNGLLSRNKANIGMAISGIMGPNSDNTDKKVGLVWYCFGYKDQIKTGHFQLNGSRSHNREEAAKNVIIKLYEFINQL